jgi:cytochrome c1
MPNVRLTEDERTDVIAYLMSLKRTSLGALAPRGEMAQAGK